MVTIQIANGRKEELMKPKVTEIKVLVNILYEIFLPEVKARLLI